MAPVLSTSGPALAVAAVGLLVLVVVHTFVAAVGFRFFRLRLDTRWAPVLYTVLTVPLLYVGTVLLVLGALGVGTGLTLDRGLLLVLLWGIPLTLGISIDLFWAPQPDEVDLPAEQ